MVVHQVVTVTFVILHVLCIVTSKAVLTQASVMDVIWGGRASSVNAEDIVKPSEIVD